MAIPKNSLLPADLVRQILVETIVKLAPVIIANYLTDEMIEKLLARVTSRL